MDAVPGEQLQLCRVHHPAHSAQWHADVNKRKQEYWARKRAEKASKVAGEGKGSDAGHNGKIEPKPSLAISQT
jgi:hypothetical protein